MTGFTQTSSVNSVQAAYEQLAYFALREQLYFDGVADIRSTNQDKPGSSVIWTQYTDLAPALTPLTEDVDVTPVEVTDDNVTVTLDEYGNASVTTAKLRGTSFLAVDADVANIIGYNAGQSLDRLARAAILGGTNVIFEGQATQAAITATDVYAAATVRQISAKLRGGNVAPIDGMYKGYIHPDQSVDLRSETGAASWTDAAIRSEQAQRRWLGLIGAFEGIDFCEAPSVALLTDAGATTTDVYQSVIVGRQSLAKAYSRSVSGELPSVVAGPITDKLRRFRPIGWHWLGGYGIFREEAVWRYETASSIGANA